MLERCFVFIVIQEFVQQENLTPAWLNLQGVFFPLAK